MNDIQGILETFAQSDEGRSVAFCFVDTPDEILGVREKQSRPSASTIKIVAAALLLRDHADRLEETIAWDEIGTNNLPALCNILQTPLKLIDVMALSISTSDNMCADYVQNFVGLEPLERFLKEVGCEGAVIKSGHSDQELQKDILQNRWSAQDAMRFCAHLHSDKIYAPLLSIMNNVVFYNRMPAALDLRHKVQHKTGTLTNYGIVGDVGIVLGDHKPFALGFLTENQEDMRETERAIGETTKALSNLFRA